MADLTEPVPSIDELPMGAMRLVTVDDREIVVCSTPSGIYAVDAICTHAYAFLDEGLLDGHEIECPLHGARFDVRTGAVVRDPATEPIATFPVEIDGARVRVRLP
jgi:nitrite reductase/ring-hydroxylating ferredoxin subunit